jgi:hypothetical protein
MHIPRRVLFVKPGCSSSLHDRACEIFYQLKGGVGTCTRITIITIIIILIIILISGLW